MNRAKKLKKNSPKQKVQDKKTGKGSILENPFVLAGIVFGLALAINYLLETNFTKNLFNWTGYYFNLALYQINSVVQPAFKDHPYIKISMLINPISPAFLATINPWMWLRGFIVASFLAGQYVTVVQIKIIDSKNIVTASVLTGICQFVMYAAPHQALFSASFFMILMQKFYINIIVLMFTSMTGLFFGMEYALFLLRNEKVTVAAKHNDRPNINVKVIDNRDKY